MLPKNERFNTTELSQLKNKKFKKIIVNNGFFVVYENTPTTPNPSSGRRGNQNKKGIMLSKKVFKKAVDRNKYKRLFYNCVLELQKENSELKSKNFIFHPKKIFSKQDLMQDLLNMI